MQVSDCLHPLYIYIGLAMKNSFPDSAECCCCCKCSETTWHSCWPKFWLWVWWLVMVALPFF